MDSTSTVTKSPSSDSESDSVVSTQLSSFIPFQTGPSLERIPDDVLLEVLSHLHAIDDSRRTRYKSLLHSKYVIPSTVTVCPSNAPTFRALSKTSRLLRSRCLAIPWRNVELCGMNFWKPHLFFDEAISKATETSIRILNACPYLFPLIQTVSVWLTSYKKAKIIPELAVFLAALPNLNTIQVIYTESGTQTVIKNAFRGKQFPSVRRISLPSSAHEIIKRCPNVEEVVCVDGDGSEIIRSIIESKCHRVRILKGISAPLTPLADLVPNLTHASVILKSDMTPLTSFFFLDTIEILVSYHVRVDIPLSESAALDIEKAREILKGNKSQAQKTVVLTKSDNIWEYRAYEFGTGRAQVTRETVEA